MLFINILSIVIETKLIINELRCLFINYFKINLENKSRDFTENKLCQEKILKIQRRKKTKT